MGVLTLVVGVIFLVVSNKSDAGFFGPSNYEECVIKDIGSAKTELAAKIIRDACEKKFREAKKIDKNEGLRKEIRICNQLIDVPDNGKDYEKEPVSEKFNRESFNKYTVEIKRVSEERVYQEKKLVVYIQSSFPDLSMSSVNIGGRRKKDQNKWDEIYECIGDGKPGVVSRFVCQNADLKLNWFGVDSVMFYGTIRDVVDVKYGCK